MNNEILKLVDVSFGYNNDLILKDMETEIRDKMYKRNSKTERR